MQKENGYEISFINPGWIKKPIPEMWVDDDLREIIIFFVINTPCTDLSSSGVELKDYGWPKDVWKNDRLKKILFDLAGIERDSSFAVAKKTNEMKNVCDRVGLRKNFYKNHNSERIAIYKGRYNEFLSICYHIRNALAHGRFVMKKIIMICFFAFEDGVKKNAKFQVRSRMILKKSTLIEWVTILKSERLPSQNRYSRPTTVS